MAHLWQWNAREKSNGCFLQLMGVCRGRKMAIGADDRKDRDDGRDMITVEMVGGTREGTGRRKAPSWRREADVMRKRQMKIRNRQ